MRVLRIFGLNQLDNIDTYLIYIYRHFVRVRALRVFVHISVGENEGEGEGEDGRKTHNVFQF